MGARVFWDGLGGFRTVAELVVALGLILAPSGVVRAEGYHGRRAEMSDVTGADGGEHDSDLDDDSFGDETPALDVADPIEPVNRAIFWFNDIVDVYLLEPVAKGYDYVVPHRAQASVASFFDTLRYPIYLFSDLITLDSERALVDSARFGINATIGFLGFFDVADEFGFKRKATDAGVAFGRWGIPEGPYIVLPILGASNLRDTVGEVFNFVLDPIVAVQFTQMSAANVDAISWGGGVTRTINRRSQMIENVTTAKQASLDYYLFVQSAYAQYRRGLIQGEESSEKALFDTRY